jgi:hypothetical protein
MGVLGQRSGQVHWFKYVPHAESGEWQRLGWQSTGSLEGTHHGAYAELMLWKGVGNPIYPPNPQSQYRDTH